MNIGVQYIPGKNNQGVDFEAIHQVYRAAYEAGTVEDLFLEQSNLQASQYKVKYFPTVIFYDPASGQELDRLECQFTPDDVGETIRAIAMGDHKKRPGINRHNIGCWLKENWLILALLIGVGYVLLKLRK